jgi:hypothetical protein
MAYNTDLNVIGSLQDYHVIQKSLESFFSGTDSVNKLIHQRNEFNLRTDKSRKRIEAAINNSFLLFKNQNHIDLMQEIFAKNCVRVMQKELILFWQFAMCNRLFFDLSVNVFMKNYFSGKVGLSKDELIGYLKEFLMKNNRLNLKWSEITIATLATKYLSFMTKLGFLTGARTKTFQHIKISGESLVLLLYCAQIAEPENKNILTNKMLPLSFVTLDDVQGRLKKLSIKGYFNMNFNGVALNIELVHSYKGICDVLYR